MKLEGVKLRTLRLFEWKESGKRKQMTREDVIKRIKRILEECKEYNEDDEIAVCYVTSDDADALDVAIKALEQEPCDDAVNRRAVLNTLNNADSVLDEDRTVERYKELLTACYIDLPSVTPAYKKDEWVSCSEETNGTD